MKKIAGVAMVLALCATMAAGQQSRTGTRPAVRRAAPAASGTELPAGAEKIQEGVYKAKDAKGKTWIYSRTPFGWTRTDESATKETAHTAETPQVRVVSVDGDKVKFERDSPFGKSVWTKSVGDLVGDEKTAYELKLAAKNEK